MKIHWLQHADFEDLGCIAPRLVARGDVVTVTRLYAGEALPEPASIDALIVMGGPMNIYEYDAHPWLRAEKDFIRAVIEAQRRVLGICLGAQLIADVLGAPTTRNANIEIGWFPVTLRAAAEKTKAFAGFPQSFDAFHWHGDTFALPPGAQPLMSSAACENQAYAVGEHIAGIQFHLEVTAANARDWFAHEKVAPAPYVQAPGQVLAQLDRFADNNRLMLRLLDNWLAPD